MLLWRKSHRHILLKVSSVPNQDITKFEPRRPIRTQFQYNLLTKQEGLPSNKSWNPFRHTLEVQRTSHQHVIRYPSTTQWLDLKIFPLPHHSLAAALVVVSAAWISAWKYHMQMQKHYLWSDIDRWPFEVIGTDILAYRSQLASVTLLQISHISWLPFMLYLSEVLFRHFDGGSNFSSNVSKFYHFYAVLKQRDTFCS
jgi:hypothetical protein